MGYLELVPGTAVVARGEPCLVVEVKPPSSVVVQAVDSREIFTTNLSELGLFPSTFDASPGCLPAGAPLRSLDNYTAKDLAIANERFFVITKFRAGELTFKEAMARTKTSKTAFYRLNRRFDTSTGRDSLLPNRPGRSKGATVLSDEVENIISEAIKNKYKGKAATYAEVWREVQAKCSKLKIPIPSKTAVTYRIKAVGEPVLFKLKHGCEAASQKYGAKPGNKPLTRPLERVQMDHTLVDCILVDEITREPLFRPWLTILVDCETRVLIGYYIAFHAPSTLSVACAITHAVLPKRQYLENIGRGEIEYPFFGIPEVIHMDNAKEFTTYKLKKACIIYGIEPQWRPLGRKHFGGHVERLLGTIMIGNVKLLPGATMSNVVQRGDYDSEKNAALTLPEFVKWFAGQAEIYNYSEHSALKCSPAEKWSKCFRLESDKKFSPKLIISQFKFKLDFMPEKERDIRPVGVRLFNRSYWSPLLKGYVGRKKVVIKYDPFNLGMVWAKIDGEYIDLKFSDLTLDNLSYEQHGASLYADSRDKSREMPSNVIAAREANEQLVESSKKMTRRAKKKIKAQEGYLRHISNQHSADSLTQPEDKLNGIDFSKKPQLFDGEVL